MTKLEKFIYAKEVLGFKCKDTGEILNKKSKVVGFVCNKGYKRFTIRIEKKRYDIIAHQFIYWFFTNEIATEEIDHIDGIRVNNNIKNLRAVNRQQNQFNRKSAKGYHWHKYHEKFHSQIRKNGKTIHLGYFDCEDDARVAYIEAKKIYHTK